MARHMRIDQLRLSGLGMPVLFVIIWSSGFIAAKYGLPYAPPLTFIVLRFAAAVAVLIPLALLARAAWPRGKVLHIAVAGVLVQAGYLGGVWCAITLGMSAGLVALIVGLQPVLTAFSAPLVGERVIGRQWLGLLFGLAGVGLVVSNKVNATGLSMASILLAILALLSITAGTLYQKRFCTNFDLRTGTLIQYAASIVVVLPLAYWLEDFSFAFERVQWTPEFFAAWAWSVLALSIGAIFLLFVLIRSSAATRVTSLMYLTPPTTAIMAWFMFGETLSLWGLCGMVFAVTGVALVVRK